MLKRAETLLLNTKRLRFFRGETYDGGADDTCASFTAFWMTTSPSKKQNRRAQRTTKEVIIDHERLHPRY
jgi:hypothetical protein